MAEEVVVNGERLNDIEWEIEQIKEDRKKIVGEIEGKKNRIKDMQELLGKSVREDYKRDIFDLLFDVDSLNDFISNSYYVGKVDKAIVNYLDGIKKDKEELENKEKELRELEKTLKELVKEEKEQSVVVEEKIEEKEKYVEGLSEENKGIIEGREIRDIEVGIEKIDIENKEDFKIEENYKVDKNEESKVEDKENKVDIDKIEEKPIEQEVIEETKVIEDDPIENENSVENSLTENDPIEKENSVNDESVKSKIVEAAYSQIGVPYVYGASEEGEAFDCSGLTSWAYSQVGIDIPHSSAGQAAMLENEVADSGELEAGDLVFYIGNGGGQSGNHVAIYAGNGQVIHANGSLVTVSDMNENWTSAGSLI